MKISALKTYLYSQANRGGLIVKIELEDGRYGLGEYGLSFQELAGAAALEHMRPELIGCDPFDTEAIWQRLARRDFFPGDAVVVSAISAIDIALWDLKGKILGQPLWRLLGGKVRDTVPAYCWLGDDKTIDAALASATRKVREGWRYVRFGVPDRDGVFDPSLAVKDTIDRVVAMRDAVGPAIGLCVDAHTRLDLPDSVRLARALESHSLYFYEDPLRSESPEAYRRFRQQTAIPIAAGEQMATKWRFRTLIEEELIDYARIDLCIVGGITEARKIAGWAEAYHIKVVPHNPLGPISSAACLHFGVSTENFVLQEAGNATDEFMRDVFPIRPAFPVANWPVPMAPGLGVGFNEQALAAYPYQDRSAPRFRRPDGSFTNW